MRPHVMKSQVITIPSLKPKVKQGPKTNMATGEPRAEV